jgi:chromatin segregation and condensation protein Rec8/ScpA/Scc1 (kleisin family)
MRQGAEKLAQCAKQGSEFELARVYSPDSPVLQPDVHSKDLHEVFVRLLEKQSKTVRHVIQREVLSMSDVMTTILQKLPESEAVEWESLLAHWHVEPFYVVSVFVGLLQLIRERTVAGKQVQPLDTWKVYRAELNEKQLSADLPPVLMEPVQLELIDTYSNVAH